MLALVYLYDAFTEELMKEEDGDLSRVGIVAKYKARFIAGMDHPIDKVWNRIKPLFREE